MRNKLELVTDQLYIHVCELYFHMGCWYDLIASIRQSWVLMLYHVFMMQVLNSAVYPGFFSRGKDRFLRLPYYIFILLKFSFIFLDNFCGGDLWIFLPIRNFPGMVIFCSRLKYLSSRLFQKIAQYCPRCVLICTPNHYSSLKLLESGSSALL